MSLDPLKKILDSVLVPELKVVSRTKVSLAGGKIGLQETYDITALIDTWKSNLETKIASKQASLKAPDVTCEQALLDVLKA